MRQKLAIIGASDFQNPLILRAKEKGLETHVFAWKDGSIGERTADYFYPISITMVDEITSKCQEIGVSGVCTIGSDLANVTVAYVASKLGLVANTIETVRRSTNKSIMRRVFVEHGDPSPESHVIREGEVPSDFGMAYPIIVKPADRSGSRGITKIVEPNDALLAKAVELALEASFSKEVIVEECMEGEEFSVEYVSWRGRHTFLALTKKYTTGPPHFIETGHLEPAPVSEVVYDKVKSVVSHALDSLGVEYGASHSEVMLLSDGQVKIVEIGSRMGGDCIGSNLVPLSTGIDFVGAVVDIALDKEPDLNPMHAPAVSMIRFVFGQDDLDALSTAKNEIPKLIDFVSPIGNLSQEIVDSGTRHGFFILSASTYSEIVPYLPPEKM